MLRGTPHKSKAWLKKVLHKNLLRMKLIATKGPVFYLSHHEILKPDSESTPCRIVFDSSATFKGHVLNNYWTKGPDLLNNLLGILIQFSENNLAMTADIKKMYHVVKISGQDQHMHRFLWRDMDISRDPDICIVTSVSYCVDGSMKNS